jgi:hypothetical protein
VLHGAGQVTEPYVDELDSLGCYEPQNLVTACEHPLSLRRSRSVRRGRALAAAARLAVTTYLVTRSRHATHPLSCLVTGLRSSREAD